MATIKSYTDIPQSKKLAEILPLESADMYYCLEQRDIASGYEIGITPFIKVKEFKGKCNIVDVQPAWSLAALLGVLPLVDFTTPQLIGTPKTLYRCMYNDDLKSHAYDNPIDACVAMIEKLHELKIL